MPAVDSGAQFVSPEGIPPPGGPYTPVAVVDGLVFVSGQAPRTADGQLASDDVADQTTQVFENIRRCLQSVGADLSDVVKVNAFLADFSDFPIFNEVYRNMFTEPFPARTTVPVALTTIRLEVECIAKLPSRR
jgi:reactive intermediate/imine deaminase